MSAPDTAEGNLRFLFTWPDATLEGDWRSVFEPLPFPGDEEVMEELVKRYLKLRRNAQGWKPRRHDHNSHRAILPVDLAALLADAGRLDRGEASSGTTVCASCGGVFLARRSSALYCSRGCQQTAYRDRSEPIAA